MLVTGEGAMAGSETHNVERALSSPLSPSVVHAYNLLMSEIMFSIAMSRELVDGR
jgi:hypothetical protein